MTIVDRFENYWYFSRRYAQFEIVSSLVAAMSEDERTLSSKAQKVLRKLNKARADCQFRIGQINLPGLGGCQACDSPCCNLAANEYFSPIDYWLRKYAAGHECQYSRRLIRKPGHYARKRLQHVARASLALPKRIIRRLARRRSPTTERLHQLTEKERMGCQFHTPNGCTLSNRDRPIKCLIFACPNLKNALTRSARSKYEKEIGELYQISIATFRILRHEVDRPPWWGSTLLKLVP